MKQMNLLTKGILLFVLTFPITIVSSHVSGAATVGSVVEGHKTCNQCHGRFPGAPNVKKGKKDQLAKIPSDRVDLLCLGCHGPAGISMLKADVHGAQNYVIAPIGCIDCHDPHDNQQHYLNGQNIKLIGQDVPNIPMPWFVESDNAQILTPNSGIRDVVFESRGTDVGEQSMNSFADGDENRDGNFSGICEVCHTRTKFHKNNPSGNHSHFTGQTCTNCHLHVNQFLAFTNNTGSDPGTGTPTVPGGSTPALTGLVSDSSGFAWSYITLFLDINGNGTWDQGEPIAVTDSNGIYTFEGIPNKSYAVLVMEGDIPEGYGVNVSTYKNVVTITTVAKPASIEGRVWSDSISNGKYNDGDEGIPGVTLFADKNENGTHDPGEPAIITDDLGFYSLNELTHGPYWIHIDETSVPEGYAFLTNNEPYYTLLAPGQTHSDVNFGYRSILYVHPFSSRMTYPTRLTWTPDGGYYVTDNKTNSVFIYDSAGTLTGHLKGLSKPLGIATDAQGRIYVGNNGRDNVEVYSKTGVLKRVLGNGEIKMPNDLAIDRDQRLYVLDSQSKHVRVFNADGTDAFTFGSAGGGDGQFSFPVALAIHYRTENNVETGEIYVADKTSARIQVFDLEGNFLRSFGGPVEKGGGMMGMSMGGFGGSTWVWKGRFAGIQSLAFDQHGRLHALDAYMDKVQILDPVSGDYLGYYDAFVTDHGAQIQLDIDISQSGRVIMTNVTANQVELIYTVP